MAKTVTPMMKSPPITISAKARTTCPAASSPSCPRVRMRRVVLRFIASRIMVVMRRTVGNELKSSGLAINRTVIRMTTEKVMEIASPKSTNNGGIGTTNTVKMTIKPSASQISPRRNRLFSPSMPPDDASTAAVV